MNASKHGRHAGQRRGGPSAAPRGLSWRQHLIKGLSWWQAVLVLLPLTLTFMGGAVGGLIGAVAALACVALARRGWNALLTAVSMACVSALAFGGYVTIAALLLSLAAPSQGAAN